MILINVQIFCAKKKNYGVTYQAPVFYCPGLNLTLFHAVHSFVLFFVYSKSEYTLESVSVSGSPSGRLHDNSSQLHSIELKFCAQNCLINISVEFEDEKDPSRNG